MLLEDFLCLHVLREVEHTKEDLLLLREVLVDAALLHKREHRLVKLLADLLAHFAVRLHREKHDNVVRARILQYQLSIGLGRELDHACRAVLLEVGDLLEALLTDVL